MINKTSVLLIQNNIKEITDITEKCIEVGICERNIFSVTEAESAERYLEIAGISYVIIDANLYNFVASSTIDKFSEYFPIQTIITNANPKQMTLRMMNDKNLVFVNDLDELPSKLLGGSVSEINSYKMVSQMSF